MLVVTALGSCRVTNPVRKAVAKYPIILNNSRVYGYVHSAAEVVQQIRFLKNRFDIPAQAHPLLMPLVDAMVHEKAIHRRSDIYIVEISSAKIVRVGSTCVQWNHVCRHFDPFLDNPQRAKTFWTLAKKSNPTEKRSFLDADPVFRRLSAIDQDLLRQMELEIVDDISLTIDIETIMQELPKVLFVTHCNPLLPTGQPIPSRAKFNELLTRVLRDCGANYCDPTQLIAQFGQDKAMRNELGSLTHYTDDFEAALFADWYQTHLAQVPPMALAG